MIRQIITETEPITIADSIRKGLAKFREKHNTDPDCILISSDFRRTLERENPPELKEKAETEEALAKMGITKTYFDNVCINWDFVPNGKVIFKQETITK